MFPPLVDVGSTSSTSRGSFAEAPDACAAAAAAAAQVDLALQKNRQNLGRRYIEVFRATKQDYYTAVAQSVRPAHSHALGASSDDGARGGSIR